MLQQASIIAELEDAIRSGSSDKRVNTLRQVTDLFLNDGERLTDDQVKVFDDVLCHLVTRVEDRVKAELGGRLAHLDFAPAGVIERLARDDEIAVASPVLSTSKRLTTSTLVDIARTKGQDHLFAISGRTNLPETVTDVLVERGERKVIRNLANNATARFSEVGYTGMLAHAEADDELTEIIGLRVDLPVKYLRELLQRATEAVRARLAALAPPELQEEIKRVLAARCPQQEARAQARLDPIEGAADGRRRQREAAARGRKTSPRCDRAEHLEFPGAIDPAGIHLCSPFKNAWPLQRLILGKGFV